MPYPIKNYQIETRDFSEMNHTKISGYLYNRKYCSYLIIAKMTMTSVEISENTLNFL